VLGFDGGEVEFGLGFENSLGEVAVAWDVGVREIHARVASWAEVVIAILGVRLLDQVLDRVGTPRVCGGSQMSVLVIGLCNINRLVG
jgi:hypothetical protein